MELDKFSMLNIMVKSDQIMVADWSKALVSQIQVGNKVA